MFDQSTVPASLIQPGVLRCYCPGTHTGVIYWVCMGGVFVNMDIMNLIVVLVSSNSVCVYVAHEAGLVALRVMKDLDTVSSSVLFEYRARNAASLPSSQLDWLSLDGEHTHTLCHEE